jgi:hypothetical protein
MQLLCRIWNYIGVFFKHLVDFAFFSLAKVCWLPWICFTFDSSIGVLKCRSVLAWPSSSPSLVFNFCAKSHWHALKTNVFLYFIGAQLERWARIYKDWVLSPQNRRCAFFFSKRKISSFIFVEESNTKLELTIAKFK